MSAPNPVVCMLTERDLQLLTEIFRLARRGSCLEDYSQTRDRMLHALDQFDIKATFKIPA